MNIYDGTFIFSESVRDERVGELTGYVTGEIEKLGGKIIGTRDMGRRPFARTMQKKESGVYIAVTFRLDPAKVGALTERYHLNEDVFRCQIVRLSDEQASKPAPVSSATPARQERTYDSKY
jgi:ribosomal protein S6